MGSKNQKTYHRSTQKRHLYKSHLVAYARAHYSKKKLRGEISVRGSKGTIFAHKNFQQISFFSILFDVHTGIQKFAEYLVQVSPFYRPHPISYRSKKRTKKTNTLEYKAFRRVQKVEKSFYSFTRKVSKTVATVQTAVNLAVAKVTTSYLNTTQKISRKIKKAFSSQARSIRLAYRWNRKKRFEFIRELKTQSSNISGDWFTKILVAPFQPFYYSIRLFPLHSFIAILLSGLIFGGTYSLHELVFKDLPSVMELSTREPAVTSKIMDRNGQVLYRVYKDENRTIVPLSYISPNLVKATIAIEDKEFYNHHGFSLRGITRAAIANFQGGISQGGSTITQQLVKQRLLTSERTWSRKVKEVILSVLVEGTYSKDEILSMYLNQVPYGGSTYGIEEASQRYFGKSSHELTLAESALLAGLPQSPTVYSPFGQNPDRAKLRQAEVLRRMVEDQYISEADAQAALGETLAFREDQIDILAPHFVMYVRELLAEKYGEESLLTEGLEIKTTLDLNLQNNVQNIVTKEVNQLKNYRISNGAAVVTDPRTGEVLAMVGSTDYFDFEHSGQVNVTTRERQPGSSIKPVTYALALEKGSTVTSLIQDQPVTYNIAGSPPYSPKNYDGKYHGNVPLKEALASSYNIPAVKLLENVGVNAMISKAEAMGITTWKDRKRFGLSLTLGGGEVRMIDMAAVYSSFANQGISTPLNPILEITNYKGEVLYRNECALSGKDCNGKKVLDPRVAFLISNILSDNNARTPAFGPLSELFIPGQEVAVKTGTTNRMIDNWAIGYTTDRLTAVWVGNNDSTPMSHVASGVTGASPIWNKIMRLQLNDESPHKFPVPSGIVKVPSCYKTGSQTRSSEEYYISGTEPKSTCNVATNRTNKPASVASEIRN